MKVVYARISANEHNISMQLDALKRAGCKKMFQDKVSGANNERPGFKKAAKYLRKGDTLVVWRLDRLGRSLKHLIEMVIYLEGRGVGLLSLQESIDTTTSYGRLIFHIFGALTEFERYLIRERAKAGLVAARARGRKGHWPRLLNDKKIKVLPDLYSERDHSAKEICEIIGISKSTFYSYLGTRGIKK